MTFKQFTKKYGTRSLTILVKTARQFPENKELSRAVDKVLEELESALDTFITKE